MKHVALFLLLIGLATETSPSFGKSIEWIRDYHQGRVMALRDLKPVLLDFWASWCGPCLKMDRETYNNRRVVQFDEVLHFIQVDLDRAPEVASRYGIDSIPALILLDPFGNEIGRRGGFVGPSDMAKMLGSLPTDFSELMPWMEELGPTSKSYDALLSAAPVYRKLGLAKVSLSQVERVLKFSKKEHERLELAYRQKGLNLLVLGRDKKAAELFSKRLEDCGNCPETPFFLLGMGKAHYRRGKKKQAREVYERLLEEYPESDFAQIAEQSLRALR